MATAHNMSTALIRMTASYLVVGGWSLKRLRHGRPIGQGCGSSMRRVVTCSNAAQVERLTAPIEDPGSDIPCTARVPFPAHRDAAPARSGPSMPRGPRAKSDDVAPRVACGREVEGQGSRKAGDAGQENQAHRSRFARSGEGNLTHALPYELAACEHAAAEVGHMAAPDHAAHSVSRAFLPRRRHPPWP